MLKRIRGTSGDTIVEVLISLAVLSMAFVISYATANRALIDTQNAQEHSMALEYLDSQIEALHYYLGQPGQSLPTGSFYMQPNLNNGTVQFSQGVLNEQGNGFVYEVSISLDQNIPKSLDQNIPKCLDQNIPNTYHAVVTWPGLGSLPEQCEELSYRIY